MTLSEARPASFSSSLSLSSLYETLPSQTQDDALPFPPLPGEIILRIVQLATRQAMYSYSSRSRNGRLTSPIYSYRYNCQGCHGALIQQLPDPLDDMFRTPRDAPDTSREEERQQRTLKSLCIPPDERYQHLCRAPARDTFTIKSLLRVCKDVRRWTLEEALHTVILSNERTFGSFVRLLRRGGEDGGWLSLDLRERVKRLWISGKLLQSTFVSTQLYQFMLPLLHRLEALSICNASTANTFLECTGIRQPYHNFVFQETFIPSFNTGRILGFPCERVEADVNDLVARQDIMDFLIDESPAPPPPARLSDKSFPVPFGTCLRTLTLTNTIVPDFEETFEERGGRRANPFLNVEHLRLIMPLVPLRGSQYQRGPPNWKLLSNLVPKPGSGPGQGGKLKTVELIEPWPSALGAVPHATGLETQRSLFDALVVYPHAAGKATKDVKPVQVVVSSYDPETFSDFYVDWQITRAYYNAPLSSASMPLGAPKRRRGLPPTLEIRSLAHTMSRNWVGQWGAEHQQIIASWNLEAWLDDDRSVGPSDPYFDSSTDSFTDRSDSVPHSVNL